MIYSTDNICKTYFALVSPSWDPNGPLVNNARQSLNMKCYSSWYFRQDITPRIINAVASSVGKPPLLAVSGFYGTENHNLFHTNNQISPWVEFEFDNVVTITKIIVRARYSTVYGITAFDEMKAKVGNASYTASNSWSSHISTGNYGTFSGQGAIIVYKLNPPRAGKYLGFKYTENDPYHVVIADLKVIGF